MQNFIPSNGRENKILPDDRICRQSQSVPSQPKDYSALKAIPGSFLALRYPENGHVSFPASTPGKPDKGGYIHIYSTTDPRPTDTLQGILQWNGAGSGGDKRGRLLAAQHFDDRQRYQVDDDKIPKSDSDCSHTSQVH